MTELAPEILDWIAAAAGGDVLSAVAVPAGGRLGYMVDVKTPAGETLELFLQRGRGDIGGSSFMPFDREAEVYWALEPVGIPIPHVWGVDVARNVFLVDRARGITWFHPPADPNEQVQVAQDFMRHLAAWHRTTARGLQLPSFGPVRTVREHQLDQLAGIRTVFEEQDAAQPIDALARLSLEFLESKVPDFDGEPVLVQGDTGPGNFMYENGRITAIIDWELAHLGDPMDDIAWLSWRATQHSFPDFPARLREYEELSGITVDDDRVRYYRVNACARLGPRFGLADMGESARRRRVSQEAGSAPEADRTADGSGLIMSMLHRRMVLTALAEAIQLDLPGREVVEETVPKDHNAYYDTILGQLQTMVPRIEDRTAATLAKGVARQVKYLKEIDRNGAFFEQQELADITRLLGREHAAVEEGRPLLAEAAREGRVAVEDYLRYHWNRMVRDDYLMRTASGAMYDRGWPALR
jgi:aminoglycoside phosphotransferase (APT) family kinase protein